MRIARRAGLLQARPILTALASMLIVPTLQRHHVGKTGLEKREKRGLSPFFPGNRSSYQAWPSRIVGISSAPAGSGTGRAQSAKARGARVRTTVFTRTPFVGNTGLAIQPAA